MKCSELQWLSTRELVGNPKNPRTITQQDLNRLCDSLRANGFWEHRPIAAERQPEWTDKLVVLDGNQRLKAARRRKMKTVPVVVYEDLTDEERDDIILRSNVNNGEWDVATLQLEFEGVDFDYLGMKIELPEPEVEQPVATPTAAPVSPAADSPDDPTEPDDPTAPTEAEKMNLYFRMLGDYLYPSNNEFDIPVLLSDNQPVHLELPFAPWGAEARYKKGITTYHFYVDDYRFEQLFKDPIKLLESGCRAIVEPNCSIHDQTPMAYAIYQTYRKRYLCRYLQECGLQVWVDLNVSPHFEEVNALGIPDGYNAFCTRGVSGWQATLDRHLAMARRISGLETPNLLVYGGGQDIKEWAHQHGLSWTPEYMNRGRESKPADGE